MRLVTRPFAQLAALDKIAEADPHNVASFERKASLLAGAALAIAAVSLRSRPRLFLGLLGSALLYRGATGHCELYQRLGINTDRPHAERGVPGDKGIKVQVAAYVQRPADELFRYWRGLENLPSFMPHVLSVEESAEGISHWRIKGPLKSEWQWDSEIIAEQQGQMLAWRTLPGAALPNAGSVWFEPNGTGTRVKLTLQYQPPAGVLGAALAKLLGTSPAKQAKDSLIRFKNLMESEA